MKDRIVRACNTITPVIITTVIITLERVSLIILSLIDYILVFDCNGQHFVRYIYLY